MDLYLLRIVLLAQNTINILTKRKAIRQIINTVTFKLASSIRLSCKSIQVASVVVNIALHVFPVNPMVHRHFGSHIPL